MEKLVSRSIILWVVLITTSYVINAGFLGSSYIDLENAGFAKSNTGFGLVVWAILLYGASLITVHAVRRMGITKKESLNAALLAGVLISIPEIIMFFFYNIPSAIPVWTTIGNLIGFPIGIFVSWFLIK